MDEYQKHYADEKKSKKATRCTIPSIWYYGKSESRRTQSKSVVMTSSKRGGLMPKRYRRTFWGKETADWTEITWLYEFAKGHKTVPQQSVTCMATNYASKHPEKERHGRSTSSGSCEY